MTEHERLLPDFGNPPVVEVAISVQFNPLTRFRTPHFGFLWSKFRERFPRLEEHPPINHMVEHFGVPREPGFDIRVENVPLLPRCWFLNEQGTRLVQIQPDRFVCNWRQGLQEEEYPRFESILETFKSELELFLRFLDDENLGEWIPNQCDVSYVNQIPSGKGWSNHSEAYKIFTILDSSYSDEFLPDSEDLHLRTRYIIHDDSGIAIERLNLQIEPRFFQKNKTPLYQFTLTARGKPSNENVDAVIRFLERGREWIVKGFTSITTPLMHEIWERKQ